MKTTLILTLLGALLGIAIASYIVPTWLAWYSEPAGLPGGAQIQSLVQISEVIKYSTGKLIRGQFIGGCIGAAAGLAVSIVLRVRARRSKAEAVATSAPTTPKV